MGGPRFPRPKKAEGKKKDEKKKVTVTFFSRRARKYAEMEVDVKMRQLPPGDRD